MSEHQFSSLRISRKDNLKSSDLLQLAHGNIDVLHIQGFYPSDLCKILSEKLIQDPRKGYFAKDNRIARIGMPHFDIIDTETFNRYHSEAIDSIQQLRKSVFPYLSPIDYFRLVLEETWPAGAQLEQLYGKKCFVGICRILEGESEIPPHTDKLERDSPDSFQAKSLIGQWAANIYLKLPEEGGELELWLKEPNESEYQSLIKQTKNYTIPRECLDQPVIKIRPEAGDLILFDSRKIHAVRPGSSGYRIGMGSFIGYRGDHSPLSYWS